MITQKTGSIGAAWPPRHDARNSRVKGFCTFKVEDGRTFDRLMTGIRSARDANPRATRTTVRAFMEPGLVNAVEQDGMRVEARVPVDNVFPGCELAYLGSNSEERMADAAVLREELRSVRGLSREKEENWDDAVSRIGRGGYSVQQLNGTVNGTIPQLLELYNEAYERYTFEINENTIAGILDNGNIVLVGTDSRERIVSSLIAEHAVIEVDGRPVHLYELSDYATLREHRGNGLMTAMQMMVVDHIRDLEHGKESIIYAEDRAAWKAVNISSRKAGLHYCGTLMKHCILVSDRSFAEQGIMENLNVWVAR